jgi:DNA-dependent protein kinase catalytic subunit
LALEARALYLAGIDAAEDGAFSDRRRVQTLGAAKRMKRAETASPTRLPEMPSPSTPALARPLASEPSTIWSALAALHRAAGDDAWYRLSLREGPLADDSATRDAVAAQLRGDARRAGDAYDALLAGSDAGSDAPARALWTRERLRCSQRLGEWDDALEDVEHIAGAAPWTVARLRPASDADERALPGAAAGGGALAAAVRATLRVASSLDDPAERAALVAKNLAPILADRRASPGSSGGFVAEELGVELALLRALDGAEDSAATHVADVRRTFRLAWVRSHPRAVLTRRVLLQPLQCATELEEMLDAARFARARRDASSPSDALRAFEETLERWRRRWPSDALDPPEVWERVAFARRAARDAFERAAPGTVARSAEFAVLGARDEMPALLRVAKGLTRAGERASAMATLVAAKDALGAKGDGVTARESWAVQKAVVKLRLAEAAERHGGPSGGAGAGGASSSSIDAKLEKTLDGMLRVVARGTLDAYPECAAEAEACVGRLAAELAGRTREGSRLQAIAREHFQRAVAVASSGGAGGADRTNTNTNTNAARSAAKASLRFAAFLDDELASREAAEARRGAASEPPRGGVFAADAGMLVRHALLALVGGGGRGALAKARHLIPRVLALLRGDALESKPTTGSTSGTSPSLEFAALAGRVPSWLFLEWTPQMISLLDAPGAGGDAVLEPLEALAAAYPSAVHADFHLSRRGFSKIGTNRSAKKLDATLVSPARDAFVRAVDLLDFPLQRLAWHRARIKLIAARAVDAERGGGGGGDVDAEMFSAAEALLGDVAAPDEPRLGNLNRRFAQMARAPLTKALGGGAGARPSNAHEWMPRALADAERTLAKRWSDAAGRSEALPRQRLAQFSQWFGSLETGSAGFATDLERRSFRDGPVEVPGQYDSLAGPPDAAAHATVVGFEPEADVFASKQRPKKITLRGSDGREYPFVAKGSEDLRQDDRIERLFRAMDALLLAHPESRRAGLKLRTFHVAPLTERVGLLEFVRDATPLLDAVGGRGKAGDALIAEHQAWIRAQALAKEDGADGRGGGGMLRRRRSGAGSAETNAKSGSTTAAHFLEAVARTPRADAKRALERLERRAALDAHPAAALALAPPRPALREALLRAAGSPESFLTARRAYAASLAASSACGWVAGVGDRHPQNILVDLADGSLVHIDFGYAFGTAVAALPIPELAPFRLTAATLGPLAPADAEAALANDMAAAMRAMRRGATLLRGVMDVFLREPLIDWQREARQVRVKAGRAADEREVSAAPAGEDEYVELKIQHAWAKLELGNPCAVTLAQCAPKHEGRAHWDGLRDAVMGGGASEEEERKEEEEEGRERPPARRASARRGASARETCDSVEEQVACLLELATDPLVLATAWSGWRPWL